MWVKRCVMKGIHTKLREVSFLSINNELFRWGRNKIRKLYCRCNKIKNKRTTGCPTTYQNRHLLNNSNTNDDIATKFEHEYVRCVRIITCAGSGHHLLPDRIEPGAPYFGKSLPVRSWTINTHFSRVYRYIFQLSCVNSQFTLTLTNNSRIV
jgi:hypothetical protein